MSIFRRRKPIAAIREALLMIRRLHASESVELDDYPALSGIFDYRPRGRI